MSPFPTRPAAGDVHRDHDWQPWAAALSSALLHVALLLIAMHASPVVVSTPQGTAAGSTVQAVFIDGTPPPPAKPDEALDTPPAASRLQVTRVPRADEPLPPDAFVAADTPAPPRMARPASRPQAAPPPAAEPPSPQRRPRNWGQPPGMLSEAHAPMHAGTAPSPAVTPGRRHDASSSESNLEAGGYQVIYDLLAEPRLRAWRDQGMTEVFLPLPGTRQLMACPLETALRRGSGPCRLLEPDDPALADIGDAREVLSMHRVYRRGELVWRGPGAYR